MKYIVRYDAATNLYEIGHYIDTHFYIIAMVKEPSIFLANAA